MKEYRISQFVWDEAHWFIFEYEGNNEEYWVYGTYNSREEAETALKAIQR